MSKKKRATKLEFLKQLIIRGLVAAVIIFVLFWAFDLFFSQKSPNLQYGVSFSAPYAQSLGLDTEEVYQGLLNDLKIKRLRLPVYWNLVEPQPDRFDFRQTDRLLDTAKSQNVEVILAVGYKLPRWPECYQPSWAVSFNPKQRQEKVLNYLSQTINHFRNRPEVVAWQVENEPLLDFGLCEKRPDGFLQEEVRLVKSLDSRPVIITDSGELGAWTHAMSTGDVMGTTLYRQVWNPLFGFFNYPMPPLFYNLKAYIIKNTFARNSQGVFITELQAEPWPPGKPLSGVSLKDQLKSFTLRQFQDTISYAARTGFVEQYLWGVEWWYYMKTQGHPEYWDFAKTLFN